MAARPWVFVIVAVVLVASVESGLAPFLEAAPVQLGQQKPPAKSSPRTDSEPRPSWPHPQSGPVVRDDGAPLEGLPEPLHPIHARPAGRQMQLDALAWFMSGRLLEKRGDMRRAFDSYKQAIAVDPNAAEVYRALVPLSLQLSRDLDEAVGFATKAVELNPDDFETLRQLGTITANLGQLPEAIKHLEQAANSKQVPKPSTMHAMLMRDLGILYQQTGQKVKAGDAFAVLFDALKSPDKYDLDVSLRSRLLADKRTTYEQIGSVLLDAGKIDLAAEAFDQAAKTTRASAGRLGYFRAKVLLAQKKPAEALEELQKYFDEQRQLQGRDAYQLLADILKEMKRSDELIGKLETLAGEDARNIILQYYLAEQYASAGNLERAQKIYEKSLEGTPNSAGFLALAAVYRKLKKPNELLEVLGRSLERADDAGKEALEKELKEVAADGEFMKLLIEAARTQAKAKPQPANFVRTGRVAAKLADQAHNYDVAAELYRLVLPLAREELSELYSELGSLLMKAKRYEEAVKLYEEAIAEPRVADQRVQNLFRLCQAKAMNGDTAGAITALEEARKILPEVPLLHYQEGWVYYHSRQYDKAIEQFEKVIARFPRDERIIRQCQFSLSAIHVQKGEYRKGEEILEKIYKQEPDDISVNNDLGYLYADQGKNLEQAEKMIRKAVEAEPDNAAYQDSLGWVLFKLGKYAEALPPLEKAASMPTGGDSTIHEHLGDCFEKLSKLNLAVESWDRALKSAEADKFPDPALVARVKEKLKQHTPPNGTPKPQQSGTP